MKKTIFILVFLATTMGCKRQPEVFEYTIRGTIAGQESGQFYLSESPRLGDEIVISYENHTFEYTGSTSNMFSTMIFPDHSLQSVFEILIEPGEIVLELNMDSLNEKSVIVSGDYNKARQKAQGAFMERFAGSDFYSDETRSEVSTWMIENSDNLFSISSLSSMESYDDYMSIDKLGDFLSSVKDKNLRNSKEFIVLTSLWIAKRDTVNSVGSKAMNFSLSDKDDNLISFKSVSKGKLTYLEKSGSWCGNTTKNTRNLLPVYEKYKEMGLEIITIVPESKRNRWGTWLQEEQFPWINLIELDSEIASNEKSYSHMLFTGGNYLVDETGTVVANDLSPESLNEFLMQRFEPEEYERYITERWEMPENIHILDIEQPIQSFDDLVEKMAGRPFIIDCWATWCSPCFDEFEYNDQLKTFLNGMNMEVVYISFDRPEDETKWINSIREHNLQGYHFRLNDSFSKDLGKIGFSGSLPAYMIVNEKGEIVEKNALRPSQTNLLYSQIESLLK